MDLPTRITICAVIVLQTAFFGCSSAPSANSNATGNTSNSVNTSNANTTHDSIEDLRSLIKVPFELEEVTWRQTNSNKRLVAVLLFSPETRRSLNAKFGTGGSAAQVNVEQWFPAELTTMGETSGEMTIEGTAFPAADFIQPPYSSGNIVFIPETNYAILDLQSS